MTSLSLGRERVPESDEPRLSKSLERIAAAVPAGQLIGFTRILARDPERRLDLARICADRVVAEGLRGNVDRALGELRWGR